MAEYIGREAAKEAICLTILHDGIRDALKCNIDDIPAADVVEVRHGRWVWKGHYLVCSECDNESDRTNFCPICGAVMDGGQDNG